VILSYAVVVIERVSACGGMVLAISGASFFARERKKKRPKQ
jgi:hypothetical protein